MDRRPWVRYLSAAVFVAIVVGWDIGVEVHHPPRTLTAVLAYIAAAIVAIALVISGVLISEPGSRRIHPLLAVGTILCIFGLLWGLGLRVAGAGADLKTENSTLQALAAGAALGAAALFAAGALRAARIAAARQTDGRTEPPHV